MSDDLEMESLARGAPDDPVGGTITVGVNLVNRCTESDRWRWCCYLVIFIVVLAVFIVIVPVALKIARET